MPMKRNFAPPLYDKTSESCDMKIVYMHGQTNGTKQKTNWTYLKLTDTPTNN